MADVLLTDDMSRFGLGRIHVMRAGQEPDFDHWMAEIERRGGQVVDVYAWCEDALEMHHLYVAWRLTMIKEPMYCYQIEKGKISEAVTLAAAGLYKRTGRVANRAVILAATGLPESVLVQENDQTAPVPVKIVQVEKGMPLGMVGVYHEEEQ